MTSILYRMNAGIPGFVSRYDSCTLVPEIITPSGTAGAPTVFGVPVVPDSAGGNVGNMRAIAASDTAIYGFLVREFPANSSQDGLGVSTPPPFGTVTVMTRGSMTVVMSGTAAAVKGGPLNIWTAASTGSHVQGGVEAASSAGNTIVVPGYFNGPADANGNVEIWFKP